MQLVTHRLTGTDPLPTALIEGVLGSHDGCLFLVAAGEEYLLLWPQGYRATADGKQIKVFDANGAAVGTTSSAVRLPGGEYRWDRDIGFVRSQLLLNEIPTGCSASHLWLVAP